MGTGSREKIKNLHRILLRWYRKNGRKLPWRSTTDSYPILVSEIMLQQTQASRVAEKFAQFLKRFPILQTLAKASKADVVRARQGMGYNNRAIRLRELARIVVEKHSAELPSDIQELQTLPGVGRYTGHAVACFAYGRRVPVVDVNIRRVLSRVMWKMKHPSAIKSEKEIWNIAKRILPGKPFEWNQALMDLGATICTSRRPSCSSCPIRSSCRSQHIGMRIYNGSRNGKKQLQEPSYDGIPRRIWRGKIIEELRRVKVDGKTSLLNLGKSIKRDFKRDEISWLKNVIRELEHDGLLSIRTHSPGMVVSLSQE